MTHDVFTIVAAVHPGASDRLKQLLETINANPAANALVPFGELPMVHFASFVVFHDPVQGDSELPPPVVPDQLVFESCIDGPFDEYADALLHAGGVALHRIFSHCVDYKPPAWDEHGDEQCPERLNEDVRRALKDYLAGKRRQPNLLHIGNPGLRVDHIRAGARLHQELDRELDAVVAHGRSSARPLELMAWLRERLNTPPSARSHWFLADATDPITDQSNGGRFPWFADQQSRLASRLLYWSPVALTVLLAGWGVFRFWHLVTFRGFVLFLLLLSAAIAIYWRWQTRGTPLKPETPAQKAHVRALKELEDKGVQNKMASLVILKSGWLTTFATRAVLFFFNIIYRTFFTDLTPGRLAGLQTIHFGHWTLLDLDTLDGRRQKALMFLSNYDGSWETYLDDFLDNLYNGVVMIWGGGVGFPKPLDGPIFKSWARSRMAIWHAWYQAYPTLTVANIENNDQIRKGLIDLPKTEDGARLWLSRFGSLKNGKEYIEAPGDALETQDIQGMVLSGYAHLPYAQYVLLHVNDGPAIRRWLEALLPHITDARPITRGTHPAFNIAFTHSGLAAIGLDTAAREAFSTAYQEGLAPDGLRHRSSALGDVDENSPERWIWGGANGESVDLLLMVYAADKNSLQREVATWAGRACANNAATLVVAPIAGELFPDGTNPAGRTLYREHFGFADGISQPEIEGTFRASSRLKASGSMHLVKPGEFLLGYTDGSGAAAPGIPIEAALDSGNWLPAAGAAAPGCHDFGRNGTYLVFRQLAQDVLGFRKFVSSAAGAAASAQDADELAARLVGRRHDGTPLAASAGDGPRENEFGFSGDPHGFACPVGAHIRRANPRDSLLDDPAAALRSANRHRLLRRGRPYGERLDPAATVAHGERGMLFICLSGDIERQFEFVQQNWINNTVFSGLGCEQDGLVGAPGGHPGCFTTQSPTVRQRTLKIPSFVTVKGGAYFFLPGLSALRYLARLTDPAAVTLARPIAQPAELPAPVGSQPTFLRRILENIERRLPGMSLAWAARYPLLMAVVLVLWPFAAAHKPTVFGSHFLVGWWGLAAVSLLASLAAFVVMIALRLVLLYGWRSRRVRPQWTGSARWLHVLGFQALALPLVAAAIRSSALDASAVPSVSYWSVVFSYAGAGVLGAVAALVLLTLASSAQALRPGSRPDLFFPQNPLSTRLAGPGAFRTRLHRPAEWLSRLSRWLVRSVPQEIGIGYIDYRNQRILPGHAFALVVGLILLAIWAVGYVLLNPAWGSGWARWGHEVPALAYLIFTLILIGTLLSALAFFFDRYNIPTVLLLAIWLASVASLARTDHVYRVVDVVKPPPLTPADIVSKALASNPNSKFIVVAAEGYGLTSSAWTAEVLATLAADAGGRQFTDALRLVSTASGASVGAMYFVDVYASGGFPTAANGSAVDPGVLSRVRRAAWQPSDSENAWGLVYPDLTRTFAPFVVPELLDRGWAMEQAWKRHMATPDATLNSWRSGVDSGWRPATAFGVTIVETGARHLFSTYDAVPCSTPGGCVDEVTQGRDLPVVTAARLSSTFPYVAPVSRARVGAPAYHLSDGGFWDNFGVMAAIEWLKQADAALAGQDVLLIEIRSSPPSPAVTPEDRAWAFELIGPALAMNGVRTNAQRVRNDLEISLLESLWSQSSPHRSLARVVFELSDPEAKLSWHIGERDVQRIRNAWSQHPNQAALANVRQFLGVP